MCGYDESSACQHYVARFAPSQTFETCPRDAGPSQHCVIRLCLWEKHSKNINSQIPIGNWGLFNKLVVGVNNDIFHLWTILVLVFIWISCCYVAEWFRLNSQEFRPNIVQVYMTLLVKDETMTHRSRFSSKKEISFSFGSENFNSRRVVSEVQL